MDYSLTFAYYAIPRFPQFPPIIPNYSFKQHHKIEHMHDVLQVFDRSGLASYPGRVFPPSPNGQGMRIDLDLTYYS